MVSPRPSASAQAPLPAPAAAPPRAPELTRSTPAAWVTSPPANGRRTSTRAPSSTTTRTASTRAGEGGVSLVNTAVRYRDGSLANNLGTDFEGVANFNETFPLFNWYVVETDVTRYKTTGIHTVYDAGGPADGSASCGRLLDIRLAELQPSASSWPTPTKQTPFRPTCRVPGAVYCPNADCTGYVDPESEPATQQFTTASTGRIDPPWVACGRLAGLLRPEQLHRVRQDSLYPPVKPAASRDTWSMPPLARSMIR